MTLEKRVTRLEETCYFQERLLSDLNAAVATQGEMLTKMSREVRALTREVLLLRDLLLPERRSAEIDALLGTRSEVACETESTR